MGVFDKGASSPKFERWTLGGGSKLSGTAAVCYEHKLPCCCFATHLPCPFDLVNPQATSVPATLLLCY